MEKEVPVKKKQEKAMEPKVSDEGLVTFDRVMAVQQTARIVEADKIGADKLLNKVDLGSEKRQIVAGMPSLYLNHYK